MCPKLLIAAVLLTACARNTPATMTPNSPSGPASEVTTSVTPEQVLDLDQAAAEILQTGKYETATFALG